MNRKDAARAAELINTLNRIKDAIAKGETDIFSEAQAMEEIRLAILFLTGDLKNKCAGKPDSIIIESFFALDGRGFVSQLAPSSVVLNLNFNNPAEPNFIGESWYVEFDDHGQELPGLQILQPILWKQIDKQHQPAARQLFGTTEMSFQGCFDNTRRASVASLAKQRIKAVGAVQYIRWSTLGALRRAYRLWRNEIGKAA